MSQQYIQEHFETHITNITASCRFSLNWIENQAVCSFMNEFFPFANPISSYQLSNHIILHKIERYWQAVKNCCCGSDVTLQTDGWTGVNFHYLLAFMITAAIQVIDVSAQRKNAQHLKILMISVIEEVQLIWIANIVAVTSDASVFADCYAHQHLTSFLGFKARPLFLQH
ncbi:hypothetical protein EDB19DRAFT_1897375 [Suillus lakei]|nr:hypothetical protein EDB19DRAFT_1897375 [Suillus lakei]